MKMVEIKMASVVKELEKLETRLEKAEAKLEKAIAKVEKMGCKWTHEEHREWLANVETTEDGWIINKEDIKKNGAWFDWWRAEDAVKEIKEKIEYAERRFEKTEEEVERHREEVAKMENLKKKEELQKLEFEAEVKEWAKDGITLERRYAGYTPNGKRFVIDRNHGFTTRSWHCFSLWIDGETIFTSGEFWRAYAVIKNN